MLAEFNNSFTFGFSKEFVMKQLSFPPLHLNYVATVFFAVLVTVFQFIRTRTPNATLMFLLLWFYDGPWQTQTAYQKLKPLTSSNYGNITGFPPTFGINQNGDIPYFFGQLTSSLDSQPPYIQYITFVELWLQEMGDFVKKTLLSSICRGIFGVNTSKWVIY